MIIRPARKHPEVRAEVMINAAIELVVVVNRLARRKEVVLKIEGIRRSGVRLRVVLQQVQCDRIETIDRNLVAGEWLAYVGASAVISRGQRIVDCDRLADAVYQLRKVSIQPV